MSNPDKDSVYAYATTPDPLLKVMPQLIEGTNRVLVSHGDFDGFIPFNGTLLAIQNMTWNGALGYQTAPSEEFIVPIPRKDALFTGPQGYMGIQHYERGLQWVLTRQAGHELPLYQPKAAWRHLEWMLGRIETL